MRKGIGAGSDAADVSPASFDDTTQREVVGVDNDVLGARDEPLIDYELRRVIVDLLIQLFDQEICLVPDYSHETSPTA